MRHLSMICLRAKCIDEVVDLVTLALAAVLPFRERCRRTYGYQRSRQHPTLLAGSEPGRQQSVVDLPGYRKSFELRRRNEQSGIVRKSVRSSVHIAFRSRNDAIAICINSCDFCCIGVEQTLLEIGDAGFKR